MVNGVVGAVMDPVQGLVEAAQKPEVVPVTALPPPTEGTIVPVHQQAVRLVTLTIVQVISKFPPFSMSSGNTIFQLGKLVTSNVTIVHLIV